LNEKRYIIGFTTAVSKLFRYRNEQLLGQKFSILLSRSEPGEGSHRDKAAYLKPMLKAIASGKMYDRNSHEFTCYSANGDDIIVTAGVSRVELDAEKVLLLELRDDSEISFHKQQGIIQEEILNGIRSSSFPIRLLSYSAPSEFYPRSAIAGVFLDFSITTSALIRPDSDMNQRVEVLDGYLGGHKGSVVVQHTFGSWITIFVDQSQNA
jgi:hypothetical protein